MVLDAREQLGVAGIKWAAGMVWDNRLENQAEARW